jgi:hypothetical protein
MATLENRANRWNNYVRDNLGTDSSQNLGSATMRNSILVLLASAEHIVQGFIPKSVMERIQGFAGSQ